VSLHPALYTLSLHDALPISSTGSRLIAAAVSPVVDWLVAITGPAVAVASPASNFCLCCQLSAYHSCWRSSLKKPNWPNASSTKRSEEHTSELSHVKISYAVF